MKFRLLFTTSLLSLLIILAMPVGLAAQAQNSQADHYTVTDLGTLPDGAFSQAANISNRGLITGVSSVADGTQHAFLWSKGRFTDIGKPGLGGPNSFAFAANERGQVDGQAESSAKDPNHENYCAYGTGLKCLAFLWEKGIMTALRTLGGNNATVGNINNRGEVVGVAENSARDPECPSVVAVNGTGPQVLDFEAVIWGPKKGNIRQLKPLQGDTVGVGLWINNESQAVGASGSCANTTSPPFVIAPHAVLWEKDGSVHDLGNLGGTTNPALLGIGNVAFVINDRGQVTGVSALPGSTATHAFLWTKRKGMKDLGALPGDINSAGLGMNNLGVVVGASIDGSMATGNPRAVVWRNGGITDLNTVIPGDSPLFLLVASGINDAGQIVGFGLTSSFDVHGFRLTPAVANRAALTTPSLVRPTVPDEARKALRR